MIPIPHDCLQFGSAKMVIFPTVVHVQCIDLNGYMLQIDVGVYD